MLYQTLEAVINLFNDYSSITSEAKYKAIHGKGHPSMLARVARVSDCSYPLDLVRLAKVSDCFHLKILTPKPMPQILPVLLTQVKAGNSSENLLNGICQYILFIEQEKVLRKYTTI